MHRIADETVSAGVAACETEALRVLVVLGHPRRGSFCEALAAAYASGARSAGADVRCLTVADMDFDPNVIERSPQQQAAEPSVREAMALVRWADHLVFVFPTWWGSMPALLKGFLDRVLMPGFAFQDREDGEGWLQLLNGKSAHLLTTMDTPPLVYRWIYRAPGLNGLGRATLGFCGIAPVHHSAFGPVKGSDTARRERWLSDAHASGSRLRDGVRTRTERMLGRVLAWVSALRLQFYPMVWAAFGLGTAAALHSSAGFAAGAFWLGLGFLFALEAAAVFVNELFDWESDRRNLHAGPFTGGSRVLVDGLLTKRQLGLGIALALATAAGAASALQPLSGTQLLLMALLALLAIGYTAPPLKLCWRGLGELNVALTHSLLVVLLGHSLQGGHIEDPLPWALSLPLFLAVLPSITLSAIPDHAADRAAGKRTLAVIFGPHAAIRIAQTAAVLAGGAVVALQLVDAATDIVRWLAPFAIAHAAWLLVRLERYRRSARPPGRIDGLMALSLSYMLWFVAVPLWALLRAAS